MTILRHKLIAPNSLPIVGIKLQDGSVSEFEYSHDTKTKVSMYILPSGSMAGAKDKEGPTMLIDSKGNEWSALDVEFHSLLHSS